MNCISDEILLIIFRSLSSRDIENLSLVCKDFYRVAQDASLHRTAVFLHDRYISPPTLHKYVSKHQHHLENLTLKDCFWLCGSSHILSAIKCCTRLKRLNLIGCRFSMSALIQVAKRNPHLHWLGWSVPEADASHCMEKDGQPTQLCQDIQQVLLKLDGLVMRFETLTSFEMLLPVFLNELRVYEFGLEYLSDRTSSHFALGNMYSIYVRSKEKFPLFLNHAFVDNRFLHFNLLVMEFVVQSVTSAALTESITELLAPGTTNSMCWKYVSPVLRTTSFRRIDLSHAMLGSEQMSWLFGLKNITHLNLSHVSSFKNNLLKAIASNCRELVSINLSHCDEWLDEDLCGLSALARHCSKLAHLNLGGLHIHASSDCTNKLCEVLATMTNLTSLAIPACGLVNNENVCTRSPSKCSLQMNTRHAVAASNPYSAGHGSPYTFSQLTSSPSQARRVSTTLLNESSPVARRALNMNSSGGADQSCAPSFSEARGSYAPSPSTSTSTSSGAQTRTAGTRHRQETHIASVGCGLDALRACKKLNELEIVDVGFHSVFSRLIGAQNAFLCPQTAHLRDRSLERLASFASLRRLTIAGISRLATFLSLDSITAACQQLEYLSVAHLGLTGHSNSLAALRRAIANCTRLRTFRIDQPHFHVTDAFLESFHACASIQAICIINKDGKIAKELAVYEQLFRACPHLVAFYMFSGASGAHGKKIQTSLTKSFKKSRPALSVAVMPFLQALTQEGLRCVPYIHMVDIVRFESRIARCWPPEHV